MLNDWHFVQLDDVSVWPLLWISAIRCVSVDYAVPILRSVWMLSIIYYMRNSYYQYERMRRCTRWAVESHRSPVWSSRLPRIHVEIQGQRNWVVSLLPFDRRTLRSSSLAIRTPSRNANRTMLCVLWWTPNPDRNLPYLRRKKKIRYRPNLHAFSWTNSDAINLTIHPENSDQFEYGQKEDHHRATECVD